MSWISMYPFEQELTFAPLTGLEVQSTSVSGSLLKVSARLSVNMAAPTIEQVLPRASSSALPPCVSLTSCGPCA